METVWQVEYDDWTREVALPQNFPHTEKFKDVREVGKHNLRTVDLICGGFPCQDISSLKENPKGLQGERSGLWKEYHRIICDLRPRYILIENVSKLLIRGFDQLLCDLAQSGYDAEWQTLRNVQFGLENERERLFIVAYPKSVRPFSVKIFKTINNQSLQSKTPTRNGTTIYLKTIGRSYPQIPEHLRMDDGRTFELSEIERAIKGYGNGVAVPVAKFIGEQILRFDKEITEL